MQRRPHRQTPDTNQLKPTPKSRPTHQAYNSGDLVNADPDKKYVLAPTDPGHPLNWEYYEAMGYSVETAAKDGVRIKMGTSPQIGKRLEWQGNVLLSCSKERADQIFKQGPTGNTGQEYYDKLMSKIKSNDLEQRVRIGGVREHIDISDLNQVGVPEMRE